jgi:SNF2 family DNA or RNA helicase
MIISNYGWEFSTFKIYADKCLIEDLNNKIWCTIPGIKYEIMEMLDSGSASIDQGNITFQTKLIIDSINHQDAYNTIGDDQLMSHELLDFFEIPKIGNGYLELKSKFAVKSKNFIILCSYRNENGVVSEIKNGPLVSTNLDSPILLNPEQFKACSLIESHFKNSPHSQAENFQLAAKLKRLELLDNIRITEGRLLQDNLVPIEDIRPRFINTSDGGIDLKLEEDTGDERFGSKVDEMGLRDSYFVVDDDKIQRKRFILGENAKTAINSYLNKNHFTKEEKKELLIDPLKYLSGFNLDDYSERVVGFGILYAPKINALKSEEKTDWVVELIGVEPEMHDESNDFVEQVPMSLEVNEDNAEEILKLINSAIENDENSFIYDGIDILITPELIKFVKKILRKHRSEGLITKSNVDEIKYSEWDRITNEIAMPTDFPLLLPNSFNDDINLYPYQSFGFGWLNWVKNYPIPGCLLADDMGMGKTYQIAALFANMKDKGYLSPSLLIVPPILVDNWKKELSKAVPTITFCFIRGKVTESDIDDIRKHDITAITYDNNNRNQRELGKIEFNAIICDEAQHIKNPAASRTQAAIALKSKFKIALTATPIENSISELWSILDFSAPGYLPPLRTFNKLYGDRSISQEEFEKSIDKLREKLAPIVLRRLKDDFLNKLLPPKEEIYHPCLIDDKQQLLQTKIHSIFQDGGVIHNFFKFFNDITIALTNPELLNGEYNELFSVNYISPKLAKTFEILDNIKENGEKVLIFADRKKVWYKIQSAIKDRYHIEPNIVHGGTTLSYRTKVTQPFGPESDAKGFDVLILSPKCAGFGLNLVGANHVIHYLRKFNPAVENQATDRVYRIGQSKLVTVHYLVATEPQRDQETVEQKLDNLLRKKRELLKDFLLASREGIITPDEIAKTIGSQLSGLTILDSDKVSPQAFEKLVANLYEKMGYNVQLTPLQDWGNDIVALGHSENENAMIQCKHKELPAKSGVGNNAVQEIIAARAQYENQHQVEFNDLIAITNGNFTEAAKIQAKANGVRLIDRPQLAHLLEQYPMSIEEVNNFV